MRITIRADAGPRIGGGHMMRCLTLAEEARRRGHEVTFVMAASGLNGRVRHAGFALVELAPEDHKPEPEPPHSHWASLPWRRDAEKTAKVPADWIVLDHYALDARWVDLLRAVQPDVQVLAMDDLDDRPLDSDLALDPARLNRRPRRFPSPATLDGPQFALLRPEFAEARPEALSRRGGAVGKVLILPGMLDAAGLAPLALKALRGLDLEAVVVMGSSSQSVAEVRALMAMNPRWSLALDATDMARRMTEADLCIGAGGSTSWERCCLGLPTIAVAVAENQTIGIAALEKAEAVKGLTLEQAQGGAIRVALEEVIGDTGMAHKAAALCDGAGVSRVMDAVEARVRPVVAEDAQRLFDWRNQPHIRAASHTQDPLVWEEHLAWLGRTLDREDGRWCIYEEGRPLGFVSATDVGDGLWRWSFYIGVPDAPAGAGGRMLARFLREVMPGTGARQLEGEVLAGNGASAALHRRLGFTEAPSDKPGVLVFRREL